MTSEEENGIVQANVAEFGQTTRSADVIEQKNADGKVLPNSQNTSLRDPLQKVHDAIIDNLDHSGFSELATEAKKLEGILPNIFLLKAEHHNDKLKIRYILPTTISKEYTMLAIKAQYGDLTDYLLETDLFQNIGLTKSATDIKVVELRIIPELESFFSKIRDTLFTPTLNPYLYVLAKPYEVHSFLAGVIDFAESEIYDASTFSENADANSHISGLYKKISLRHIAEYGKNKGVKTIARYVDEFRSLAKGDW